MAKFMVKSNSDFDMLSFFQDVEDMKKPIGDPQKSDKDTALLKINSHYTLLIDGEFNGKLTNGDVEQISIFQDNKLVLEITDVDYSFLELLVAGKKAGASAMIGLLLGDENYVFGGKGDDALMNLGPARFFGGAGNDQMYDFSGQSNRFDGETGSDTVVYLGAKNVGVTVNLADASQNKGEAAGDSYRSIENVVGTNFDDILIGDKKKNVLFGNDGSDILIGGAKADALSGGKGIDYASYQTSTAGVTVDMALTSRNTGDAAGDIFEDIEGVIGSSQADILTGDSRNNVIIGGFGDDRIDGNGGNDELWGDSETFGVDGADTFIFTGPGGASDLRRIMDFDAQDHIELSRTGFGLHPLYQLTVGSTLIIAHANPVATTNSPTFLVEQSTGNLYFDKDGNGSGSAELIANVQFHSQEYLDINDFVIV